MSSICDERGAELLYAGVPITKIFEVHVVLNKKSGAAMSLVMANSLYLAVHITVFFLG